MSYTFRLLAIGLVAISGLMSAGCRLIDRHQDELDSVVAKLESGAISPRSKLDRVTDLPKTGWLDTSADGADGTGYLCQVLRADGRFLTLYLENQRPIAATLFASNVDGHFVYWYFCESEAFARCLEAFNRSGRPTPDPKSPGSSGVTRP
jgi:hypothetical protein